MNDMTMCFPAELDPHTITRFSIGLFLTCFPGIIASSETQVPALEVIQAKACHRTFNKINTIL